MHQKTLITGKRGTTLIQQNQTNAFVAIGQRLLVHCELAFIYDQIVPHES